MAEKKNYRVAVVGGAGMWGRLYLRCYAEHPDCEVILVDRARARRREFAAHHGIERVYDTLEDLLAVEVPDIVSAILPVGAAPGAVIACVRAGVGVISCEKPIAAQLAQADQMVRICREQGAALGCGTAYWEMPHLVRTAAWLREGHLGKLTGAAIPGGLPVEVSGAGCVQLTTMRLLTGMEVEWVEGWTLPPLEGYEAPEAGEVETDCPAYGRLGLSGGIVCQIPAPRPGGEVPCRVWIEAEGGQVWMARRGPVIVRGKGAESTPVWPEFLDEPQPENFIEPVIERLMRAVDQGAAEVPCSGHDYRQALEIAIAIKLSAARGHQRVSLPLEDRSLKIYPHPYRLRGGDVVGYQSIGYEGPPQVKRRRPRRKRP